MRAYAVAGLISICVFARPAFGEPQEENRVMAEVTLDIDNDGNMDRAVLVDRPHHIDSAISAELRHCLAGMAACDAARCDSGGDKIDDIVDHAEPVGG